MNKLSEGVFEGERALYASRDLAVSDSVFRNGESPLKESRNIEVRDSIFEWKYPLWYCEGVRVERSTLLTTARSGIWYTHGITMKNCTIDAPKTFRRSTDITLEDCTMPYAQESLWGCNGVVMRRVSASGDYFAMNAKNIDIEEFSLSGNYAFDGGENLKIKNARLISKDAFWNCKNVTVEDSVIIGEYIGWNSEDVTLVNCTVQSEQGFCYMKDVKLVNCKLINTDLAFEYSTVDADVKSRIVSVKNPISGVIRANGIDELIMDSECVDVGATDISVRENASECAV